MSALLSDPWVTHGAAFLLGCVLTAFVYRRAFRAWIEDMGGGE